MRDSYELVGQPVEPFEVALDFSAATELHHYVEREFIPDLMRFRPKRHVVRALSETHDAVMIGGSFGRHHDSSPDLDIGSITMLKLAHDIDESWNLRVWDTRSRHDGTANKISRRYKVDVVGDQLVQATREVRIVRSQSDEVFKQLLDAAFMPPEPRRKVFEVPLTNDDCEQLTEHLRNVANRCIALAS